MASPLELLQESPIAPEKSQKINRCRAMFIPDSRVLSFFEKGDTIQGGSFFKGGHYLRKYGNQLTKQSKVFSVMN